MGVPARAYYFGGISQKTLISLDQRCIYHTLCKLYFLEAEETAFMADTKDTPEQGADELTTSGAHSQAKKELELLNKQTGQGEKTQEASTTLPACSEAKQESELPKEQEGQPQKTQEELIVLEAHSQIQRNQEEQMGKGLSMQSEWSALDYIKSFFCLLLQLITGGCIMAVFVFISWCCYQVGVVFEADPITVFVSRMVGLCVLGAGMFSVVIFIYGSTRDFVKFVLRGKSQQKG